MSEQKNKDPNEFNQKIKERVQASQDYYMKLKRQIQIQDEKIKRSQQMQKQKLEKIYKKAKQYSSSIDLNQNLYVPVDGQLERGSQIFMSACSSCHSLEPTSNSTTVGPSLGLLYNRKVGSDPEYQGYSQALVKNQQFWSARNLYKFMYSPQSFVKGTNCKILNGVGLKSEEDRADLIQFLRQYSKQLLLNIRIKQARVKGVAQFQSEIYSQQKSKGVLRERQ